MDVNEENEVFVKIKKRFFFFFWGGGIRGLVGGQRVDEMFWGKFTKKKIRGGGGVDVNEENEVFVKIKKRLFFFWGGGGRGDSGFGGGVRGWMRCFGENSQKKNFGGGGGRGEVRRVDVNEELMFL